MSNAELTEREQAVVELRTNPEKWKKRKPTLREVAAALKISPERARQLEVSARAKGTKV